MVRPHLVYHRRYNIGFFGLERWHPFDTRKYGRAYAELRQRFGSRLRRRTLRPARPITRDALLWVHAASYLARLNDRQYLAGALEVPQLQRVPAQLTDWFVLRPMRWATAGTILAARTALQHGLVINLSGGYHHAGPDRGEGFCIYSDIALAVHALRRDGLLGDADRVVYVDCDAHQGNGVCHAFFNDPRVLIFDLYNRAIYPAHDAKAKRRIDCDVPVSPNCHEADYLAALRSKLSTFLDAIMRTGDVRFAIYNAGADVLRGDPLGGLSVSGAGVLERDQFVLRQLLDRALPTIMLPSGGYTRQSFQLISATVSWAFETWGID